MASAASDFRAAVERGDLDGMLATLADDVVLNSPAGVIALAEAVGPQLAAAE